jgi:hypothetical protein
VTDSGTGPSSPDLLGIYLNDHLAGATAGTELARRVAAAQAATRYGSVLRTVAAEVSQDRAALARIMRALDVPARGYKISLAWLGEKAARLKLNGRLTARSPLSLVEELEILRLGVEGKAAGWRTLRARAYADTRLDPAGLDHLITRARSQADLLEDLRVQAASDAFS